MTDQNAPALSGAVDTLMAELEKEAAWLAELNETMAHAEKRRTRLAQALDSSLKTLDPGARRPYEDRLFMLVCPTPPNRRPQPESPTVRATLRLIAYWERLTITTTDIRLHLDRHLHTYHRTFPHRFMKSLEKQGVALKVAHGTYRITRMHPKLVYRRMQGKERIPLRADLPEDAL